MYNYALYTTNNNNIKAVELIAINPNTYTFKVPIEEEYFLYSIFIGGSQSGVDVVSYEQNGLEPHYFQLSVLNDTDITFDTEIDQNYFYPAGQNLYFKTRYNLSAEQCAINLLNRDISKILKKININSIPHYNQAKRITILDYSLPLVNLFKSLPYITFRLPLDWHIIDNPNIFIEFYINGLLVVSKEINPTLAPNNHVWIYGIKITIDAPDMDYTILDKCYIIPSHYLFITDNSDSFVISNPPTHLEDNSGPFQVDFLA